MDYVTVQEQIMLPPLDRLELSPNAFLIMGTVGTVSHFIHKSTHVCHRLSPARHLSLGANFLAEEVALADVSAYHGRFQSWTSVHKLRGEL